MNEFTLNRRALGEVLGTGFLLTVVVGSGIMGERLSGGNLAITLLANSLATGAGLISLILMLRNISGAHFNPIVTLVEALRGNIEKREVPVYILAQIAGAFIGVISAHLMFGDALLSPSLHDRSGMPQLFSEFIATFGLVAVIRGVGRSHKAQVPYAIGAYIMAAYWFTSSTSFANPAVTIARAFTPTFSGIRPTDVLGFIVVQIVAAIAAEVLFKWFEYLPNFKKEIGT